MSIVLTNADLRALAASQEALLSPLAHETPAQWQAAVRASVKRLLGAEKAISILPLGDAPVAMADEEEEGAIAQYQAYYHQLDPGLQVRRRELGLEVCQLEDLYDLRTFAESELWVDWGAPHALYAPLFMTVDLDRSTPLAALLCYRDSSRAPAFGERGRALMHLLLPAFRAGVRSCRLFGQRQTALLQLIDRFDAGILVATLDGRVVHETPALGRLLRGDPDRAMLRDRLRKAAALTGGIVARRSNHGRAPITMGGEHQEIRTTAKRYRLFASHIPLVDVPSRGLVLVVLEPVPRRPFTDEELRTRYGLSARQVEVARLLERGQTAPEIAATLGISVYTARHHIEHLRGKLGVHTAAGVTATLRQQTE